MQRSRCKSSLLDEHWKRKQRLKVRTTKLNECQTTESRTTKIRDETVRVGKRTVRKTAMTCDIMRATVADASTRRKLDCRRRLNKKCSTGYNSQKEAARKFNKRPAARALSFEVLPRLIPSDANLITLMLFTYCCCLTGSQVVASGGGGDGSGGGGQGSHAGHHMQSQTSADPRPTIYSGQVSFGLLLSAHSSLGAELSTSASHQHSERVALVPPPEETNEEVQEDSNSTNQRAIITTTILPSPSTSTGTMGDVSLSATTRPRTTLKVAPPEISINTSSNSLLSLYEPLATSESAVYSNHTRSQRDAHQLRKRQIFEQRQKNTNRYQNARSQQQHNANSKLVRQSQLFETSPMCSQINANALYAGMGAIWASHQANLVGDSQLTIGTYVYDSCNDLDVGQRQSVRIVSNLNAFQQTTCEAPRGSPISLTIAHGDNQLKAIQLLTSFRVPVVSTKEPFEIEDYEKLSRDQRRFLFSTAHSSRHLASGALRFTKRIVSRLSSSPNLPNRDHKSSPKNGFIVISQNLPSKFVSYLLETIPGIVNYEMLLSERPIDQISSAEVLERNLMKPGDTTTSASEPRGSKIINRRHDKDSSLYDSLTASSNSAINDDAESSTGESGSNQDEDQPKMLSPAILMFITSSEAIDLVTRLRNDLAKVSSYYSLIVATREDISPALQTIFHRGGSRLCSGKAFYTVSPKPDDIGEFSRYFRDTIQVEGENSDHPLICEYAKYKSMTKTSSDLDDIGTEPVIKAVWAAAAAFKSVYRKECSGSASSNNNQSPSSNVSRAQSDSSVSSGPASTPGTSGRVMNSRQSTGSKTSECMIKMNKNLSVLVQRALKQLDVTINSTGLQAFDGFKIKFDELNELMTNKFSIKYINKECEITELGHYSGLKNSLLSLDEDTLAKSLESTLPDAWPIKPIAPILRAHQTTVTDGGRSNSGEAPSATAKMDPLPMDTTSSSPSDTESSDNSGRKLNGRRDEGRASDGSSPMRSESSSEDDDSIASGLVERGGAGSESTYTETPIRPINLDPKKKSREHTNQNASGRRNAATDSSRVTQRKRQQPITASGRGLPGVTDSETTTQATITSSTRGRIQRNSSEEPPTTNKPMRELKPFPAQTIGTTLKEWIPSSDSIDFTTTTTRQPATPVTSSQPRSTSPMSASRLYDSDGERVDPDQPPMDLKQKATTQAPAVYTTLPESDGNTDLDHPPTRVASRRQSKSTTSRANLETSATTESSDYIASAPPQTGSSTDSHIPLGRLDLLLNKPLINQTYRAVSASGIDSVSDYKSSRLPTKLNYLSADLNTSPVPLSTPGSTIITARESRLINNLRPTGAVFSDPERRSKLRSHLKWIYSSWFGLTILAANICGALITLYILTFLLLKNCDGSLDRENQGIRSMHLLAIIVVFFGSTLFIVYPTPGLCLLRTSWQNFALVLLFSTLLLQSMQARSMRTLGLGGRPNRLNQFLTLVFMVGVQISFELQRWKYESANYMNFVQQHFGSGTTEVNQKLSMLSNSITTQFNLMDSFNDQVTPVSIQLSEQYQNLLSDYCTQRLDDYLQSQIYLLTLVLLLAIFSASTRNSSSLLSKGNQSGKLGSRRKLTSANLSAASGNLVASEHEANITPSHFQSPFTSTNTMSGGKPEFGNVFVVSIVCIPIYMVSVFLHISGQNSINRDLIPSVTMVMIAFSALIGIFLPVLRQIHRYEDFIDASLPGATRTVFDQQNSRMRQGNLNNPSPTPASAAFTMFPEFAQTGLKRPASTSGESGSGAGSRRPFADTKESRRNMGAMLASLGPSVDSLRGMGFYDSRGAMDDCGGKIDPGMLNLKLNLGNDNMSALDELSALDSRNQQAQDRLGKGETRLIMLDVDPCCPRHGVAAWPRGEPSSSKGCRSRAPNLH